MRGPSQFDAFAAERAQRTQRPALIASYDARIRAFLDRYAGNTHLAMRRTAVNSRTSFTRPPCAHQPACTDLQPLAAPR